MDAFLRKVVLERELEQEAALLAAPCTMKCSRCGATLSPAREDIGICTDCCSSGWATQRLRQQRAAPPLLKLAPMPEPEPPPKVRAPPGWKLLCDCGRAIRRRGAGAEDRIRLRLCRICAKRPHLRACNACGKVPEVPLHPRRPVCGSCVVRYDVPKRGVR